MATEGVTSARTWRVAIMKDRGQPMMGLHALHTAFRGLPNVEVVAVVDSKAATAEDTMRQTQAKRLYSEYLEMLDAECPDIVVICSRHPGDHLPQIEAAATRGIHLYCEKPMAAELPDADRIVALAEAHGITICMAHPARYSHSYRTMKAMIEAGEIGTPLCIHGRGKSDHRGGGEDLMVLGTHILDLQTYFFGEPISVMAEVTANGQPIEADDRSKTMEPIGPTAGDEIFASFRFPGGVRGVFESRRGWAAETAGAIHMGITVTGTKGALSMRFCDAGTPVCRLRISRQLGPIEAGSSFEDVPLTCTSTIPGADPLDYSLCGQRDIPGATWFLEANRLAAWDLLGAIEHGRLPISNIYNARLALEMIHGIYASSLERRTIDFPLTNRAHPLAKCIL